MTVEPTWQGIPYTIKEDIVKYLDYKSRFRLRVCSKSDLELVDGCPIILRKIELYATPIEDCVNYPHVLYINNSIEIRENVVDHFLGIFKHNRTIVKRLVLEFHKFRHIPNALVGLLVRKIYSLNGTVRIKVKEIQCKGEFNEGCWNIFKILDPHAIVSIFIQSHRLRNEERFPILQLDVWKNAKQITIGKGYRASNIPIENFLHCDKFRFAMSKISPEETWKLINSFITRSPIRPGFGFIVSSLTKLTPEQLLSKLEEELMKVAVFQRNGSTRSFYHFPTTEPDLIFVLEASSFIRVGLRRLFELEGFVCRKTNLDDDFRMFHNSSIMEHLEESRIIHNNYPTAPNYLARPEPNPEPSVPPDYFYYGPYLNVPPQLNPPAENPVVENPVVSIPVGHDDSLYFAPGDN